MWHLPSYFVCCALGNNQLTDLSLKALCSSSHSLHRLHAAQCPRMTDASLKSVAALRNLQHLDISLCNKCVFDCWSVTSRILDAAPFHFCVLCISEWVIKGFTTWSKVPQPPNCESWMLATAVTSLISLSGGLQKGIQYDCTHTHTNISCCALINSVSVIAAPLCCVCVLSGCVSCTTSTWVTARDWPTRLWSGWVAALSALWTSVVATFRIRYFLHVTHSF